MSNSEQSFVEYGYSYDEEAYQGHFPTREAALAEARQDDANATVWTGRAVPLNLSLFVPDGEEIIERVQERASDEFPWDVLADIPSVAINALTEAARAAFARWLADYKIKSDYYTVEDVVEHCGAADGGETR